MLCVCHVVWLKCVTPLALPLVKHWDVFLFLFLHSKNCVFYFRLHMLKQHYAYNMYSKGQKY